MPVDEAFIGAGREPGTRIWRIEMDPLHKSFQKVMGRTSSWPVWKMRKMKVVPIDETTYGDFYSGDSYIVLRTEKKGTALKMDIHFWLGQKTTQDEAGVAAYKTVELDDYLGGAPVQHRETQGHESRKFLSYFNTGVKDGIKYLDGGVESGFRKKEKKEPRLLHLKGKKYVRCQQVPLSIESLNTGDVFILDLEHQIYIWMGAKSNRQEQMKGMEVARQIRDNDNNGKSKIDVITHPQTSFHTAFFRAIGADTTRRVEVPEAKEQDEVFEHKLGSNTILSRVSDASGQLEVEIVATGKLKRSYLDANDCFILEAGRNGIFVWHGKHCTKQEKLGSWRMAAEYLKSKNYPDWVQITGVVDGGETTLFKQCFQDWPVDEVPVTGTPSRAFGSNVAKVEQRGVDVKSLHNRDQPAKPETLPDDGSGKVTVYRVQNFDMKEIPRDMYGVFFGGDSYVINYEYVKHYKQYHIVYFWLGTMSSTDEQGTAAILAKKMDDSYSGAATIIRVTQNKEPEHFLRVFKGKMVVFKGGSASGFRNRRQMEQEDEEKVMLFQVKGTNEFNTKAVQVSCRAAALNSNDVFVLVASTFRTFVWKGKGASDDERTVAVNTARHLTKSSEIEIFDEGDESDEFWEELGGRETYATGGTLSVAIHDYPTRLFQCSNASGRFDVEEIFDFSQEDLCSEDVMLLDTFDEIFVWIGRGANDVEKKEAMKTALEYLETDPAGRTSDSTNVYQVKQGNEPINFTAHFHAWNHDLYRGDVYTKMRADLDRENAKVTLVADELRKYSYANTHPYSVLSKPAPWPEGVNPSCREKYLSDDEFESLFKMTKKKFETLQTWKQIDLRKKMKLF